MKSTKPEGVQRMTCPMLVRPGFKSAARLKNPYDGKQMQGCGKAQK